MEQTTYLVRVILVDGKNKMVVTEEVTAFDYFTDSNNNLVFNDANGDMIREYHNYNWISLEPKP